MISLYLIPAKLETNELIRELTASLNAHIIEIHWGLISHSTLKGRVICVWNHMYSIIKSVVL